VVIRCCDLIVGLIVDGVPHWVSETYINNIKAMGLEDPGQLNFEQAERNIPHVIAFWKSDHQQNPNH